MVTPTPTPTPNNGFTNGPGSFGGDGSAGTWQLVEGNDGKMYERNTVTGVSRLAPTEFQPTPEASLMLPYSTNQEVNRVMGRRGESANIVPRTAYTPATSSAGKNALATALGVDPGTFAYVQALQEAGLITATTAQKMLGIGESSGGGGGGGGGSGADPAILARQMLMDKQNSALQIYDAIAGQQSVADQRMQATKQNQLAALPYAVDPSMTHFPGWGEGSAVVDRYGLTDAVPIRHTSFDPTVGPSPYDDALAKALDTYRQLAGV